MDFETYKQARLSGQSPTEAFKAPTTQPKEEGFSAAKTVGNIPSSSGKFLGGIVGAVTSPIQTAKAVGKIAAGGVEKLIPGEQAEEANFDALTNFYKERYGSIEKGLKTIQNDPVGFLSDASILLSGGGAAVSKLGTVSKIGKVAKAGNILSEVGNAINPLTIAGKAISPLQNLMPKLAAKIEETNWRITKTKEGSLLTRASGEQLDKLSIVTKNKLNETARFLAEKKITGDPMNRFAKATEIYNGIESELDKFFGSIAKGNGIKKDAVTNSLEAVKGAYKNTRYYESVSNQVNSAIDVVKKQFPDVVPYKVLNTFKKSFYDGAYSDTGKVLNSIEHMMGDNMRGLLVGGLKGTKVAGKSFEQFMRDYGLLIEGRRLIKEAVGKSQMAPMTERILGGLIGYAAGLGWGAVGTGALGPIIFENLPVTAAKSQIGKVAQTLGEVGLPSGASALKVPLSTVNQVRQSQQK